MKIAIIGPETCQKTNAIKELLFKVRQEEKNAIILSGGNKTGIEYDVKKYALLFEFDYQEYNPSYTGWNMYSVLKEEYFNKGFHPTQLIDRYRILVRNCDKLFIGYEPESKSWKPLYESTKRYAEKLGKEVVFI
jgi:hypothetical protein